MSRDPISIATTEILLPLLLPHGFVRLTNRFTARVVDEIVQFVSVRVSARGTRSFRLQYASISLLPPRDTLPLQPGGTIYIEQDSKFFWDRLFRRKFRRTAFPGATDEDACASMSSLCSHLDSQAFQFFEQTDTIEELCNYLKNERWGAEHHRHFQIGCCLTKLGNFTEATNELTLAEKLYVNDGREWCSENIAQVQSLLNAIQCGSSDSLLKGWANSTIKELKLESLIANDFK